MALLIIAGRILIEAAGYAGPLPSSAQTPAVPLDRITSVVEQRAGEWEPMTDPLITIENGIQVKSSNVHGVEVEGVQYYYRFTRGFSYDPVTRGDVERYTVVTVLNGGTPFETEVYRID